MKQENKRTECHTELQPLIDKYLDGRTSGSEEKQLRKYFASNSVAQEHRYLSPLFGPIPATILQEIEDKEAALPLLTGGKQHSIFSRRILAWASVAAVLTLAVGIGNKMYRDQFRFDNFDNSYVIVAGEQINNTALAQHLALDALDAATPKRQNVVDLLLPE